MASASWRARATSPQAPEVVIEFVFESEFVFVFESNAGQLTLLRHTQMRGRHAAAHWRQIVPGFTVDRVRSRAVIEAVA